MYAKNSTLNSNELTIITSPAGATGGKGIAKTCATMRRGMELNKNIVRKSPHHLVQRLLVRSVRLQVAKPQVDDVPAELFKAEGETALDSVRMHRICVANGETE